MGYLAATGVILVLGLIIGFISMVIGLFVGHIILFDSIALGIIAGVCCNHFLTLHPALCLLVGIAVCGLFLFLQNTSFGFWIIGILLSAVWAVIFAIISLIFSGGVMIWFLVVLGIAFVIMLLLHIRARDM